MFLVSLLVLLVTVIGHITLCVAIINRIHAVDWPRGLVDGITAFLGIAILFGPVAMVLLLAMSGSDSPGKWPQFLSAYSGACSAVLLMGVLLRVQQRFDPERRGAIRSEKVETLDLREQMGAQPFGPGLSRLYGRLPGNQILRPLVVERELNLPTLKPELGGLTIAHLSDLHMSGRLGKEYFHEVVRRVNAWNPDFIAITGDIIETEECLPWAAEVLGALDGAAGKILHPRQSRQEKSRSHTRAAGTHGDRHDRPWRCVPHHRSAGPNASVVRQRGALVRPAD